MDNEKNIKDDASIDLREIRRGKVTLNDNIKRKLEDILNNSNNAKAIQERIITVRDGRYVIPIKSDFKGHFGSFVIMMVVMFFINAITGGAWWFQWALLGWGIGVAFHFKGAYFPTEDEIEKGVRKLKKKRGIST